MMLQSEISLKHHQSQLGQKRTVLIEGWDDEKKLFQGRQEGQAPDIDGYTYVETPRDRLKPGQYVLVQLKKAFPYDFISVLNEN